MEIHQIQIAELMATPKTVFVIPVYQRNYKWKIENCRQLLFDILDVGKNEKRNGHFLGSIVYINHGNSSIGSVKEYAVIDGQQRLTTLTLIFAVLYHLAKERGDENCAADMYDYIINQRVPESEKLKLKPTEDYTACLQYILGDKSIVIPLDSRLIENYEFFKKEISQENFETIQKGIAKLVSVEIKLDQHDDDPQQIFESLNAKGLDLEQADLIRNYILMRLPERKQTDFYDKYWKLIENNAKDKMSGEDKVSDFIRDFLTLKTKNIVSKPNVYEAFKNYRQENNEELETLLGELKTLSKYYQNLLNPASESDNGIQKHLAYIKQIEVSVAYPFLMQVYADYHNEVIDKKMFIGVLEFVQAYTWRRFICGNQTGGLNKVFKTLYEKVEPTDYLRSVQRAIISLQGTIHFPTNSEVINALKTKDVYNIKTTNSFYLFERLENFNNNELVSLPNEEITREHIFPQHPEVDWADDLIEEEQNDIVGNYLHTVGNLTLSGNNGALGNKTFVEKRDMNVNGKEQGYKFSRLWLNRDLQQLDVWNKEQIEKRTQRLTERFLQVWMYPDVLPENTSISYEEVNIFEASDPSRQKIDYAVFRGERLESNSLKKGAVKGLYLAIVQKLFAENPDKFLRTNLKQRLTITEAPLRGQSRNGQNLLSSKLADGWYIKSTANPETLFKWIKAILIDFGLQDALRIKYRER